VAFDLLTGDAREILRGLPTASIDLVFTSPPYEGQRTYEDGMPGGQKFRRHGQDWCDWLAPILVECARVSRGLVVVNMSAPVRQFRYTASVEWLVADLTRSYGLACGPSPYCWLKSAGVPGSGGKRKLRSGARLPVYHRRDWEPIYAFCRPERLPLAWTDPLAFAEPPKCAPGGEFSTRQKDGRRTGSRFHSKRDTNGQVNRKWYTPPPLANPGNVIRVDVGGGHMGDDSAHDGEAPMPLAVAERIVRWYCPPGGWVLDPFCGTGTTIHAAVIHGRNGCGIDLRPNQIAIARRRLQGLTATTAQREGDDDGNAC